LLARLQRRHFFACGVLKIHSEPQDRNKEPGSAGNDVLGDLAPFFRTQLRNPLVVRLDLGADGRAVHVSILRLYNGNRIWLASRARSKHARQCNWRDQYSQFQFVSPHFSLTGFPTRIFSLTRYFSSISRRFFTRPYVVANDSHSPWLREFQSKVEIDAARIFPCVRATNDGCGAASNLRFKPPIADGMKNDA
jgi:hypothetical protein